MASSLDLLLAGIANVTTALHNPPANSPLTPLSNSQSAALQQLMTILHGTIKPKVPPAQNSPATNVPALRVPTIPADPTPQASLARNIPAIYMPSLRVPTVPVDPALHDSPVRVTSIIPPCRIASPNTITLSQMGPHLILADPDMILPTNDIVPGPRATKNSWPNGPHLIPNEHDDCMVPTSNSSSKHMKCQCCRACTHATM